MNNNIGLHIRLTSTLTDVIKKAIRLDIPFFQTFLTFTDGKHIELEKNDIREFLTLRRERFNKVYLHGSYWINLCTYQNYGYKILEREVKMAKELEFTDIILHPGSAKSCTSKSQGIRFLAESINKILKKESDINIVFENTAHGKMSVGSDITDFSEILSLMEYPERVSFCLDTAHAYSFGYDVSNISGQEKFLKLVEENIGLNRISLIHVNDTSEKLGRCIDKHDLPGQGNIGKVALKNFLEHPQLITLPKLLELPLLSEEEEKIILDDIRKW
ncbi:MAG: deoxyribonuclease IV [Candidatus Babeliales bacterium]|nr:deoxyribonuclease IV [Candidatus Babeliales bacterium]